jgi:biopolymer transport protein ExbD
MLRRLHRRDQHASWRVNMTPMIDVTFLLLTFFLLASQLASAEKVEIDLPKPHESQAVERRIPEKIIINLLNEGKDAEPGLTLGAVRLNSKVELADRLRGLAARNPDLQVILRADRNLEYHAVREIMEMIAAENLSRLQVVAELSHPGQ